MFGSLKQKLQSLSPLTSPTTSPTVSPRPKRKFVFGRANRKRRGIVGGYAKEDLREVQSEPELDYETCEKKRDRRFFGDRRKVSAPPIPNTSNNYPSINFPINTSTSNVHSRSNGNLHSNGGLKILPTPSSSNNPYSSVYSGTVYSTAKNKVDTNDQNIYEDVHPAKGPHVSVYNISSHPSASPSSGIKVKINNPETKKDPVHHHHRANNNGSAHHVSNVNVPEYYCRSGPVSVRTENVSNIYDNYKICGSRRLGVTDEPKSLQDHRMIRGTGQNHNKSDAKNRAPLLPHNNSHIYAPIKISDNYVGNKHNGTENNMSNGTSIKHGVSEDKRRIVINQNSETRKTSLEPRKIAPPDYHRTMSSDYYQTYGYVNRSDEPYPLQPSEDIYDVPTRIARKVNSRPHTDKHSTSHQSRTVGKMEGLRQVQQITIVTNELSNCVLIQSTWYRKLTILYFLSCTRRKRELSIVSAVAWRHKCVFFYGISLQFILWTCQVKYA